MGVWSSPGFLLDRIIVFLRMEPTPFTRSHEKPPFHPPYLLTLLYTQFANPCSRTFHVDLVVLQNCKPRGQGLCFLFPFYPQALERCLAQGGMPEELQNWQGRWCRTTARPNTQETEAEESGANLNTQ